jgi:hypothetical protein
VVAVCRGSGAQGCSSGQWYLVPRMAWLVCRTAATPAASDDVGLPFRDLVWDVVAAAAATLEFGTAT